MKILDRKIGPGEPAYIIAELSANHHQKYEAAVELLHAAKDAGADAVKLQTYTADTITFNSKSEYFQIKSGTLWDGKTLYDLYQEAYTPWEWQPKLKLEADHLGIHLFSSPFDFTAVDFLEKMKVPAYKVASFELVDLPLIQKMAKTGKPLIMSTGMATRDEIKEAVNAAKAGGAKDIALLKCTSAYPAPAEEMNLRTIADLSKAFGLPVGLSDHTLGIEVPVAAVALGANLVEKHIVASRAAGGPDSAFSLEPWEFKAMVRAVRNAEKSLGQVHYGPAPHEKKNTGFRRSLFVVKDMRAGEVFTAENTRSIRPANGLPPKHLNEVLGRKAKNDIKAGTPLQWDSIA
jgi:pseudaminic acid synthase